MFFFNIFVVFLLILANICGGKWLNSYTYKNCSKIIEHVIYTKKIYWSKSTASFGSFVLSKPTYLESCFTEAFLNLW